MRILNALIRRVLPSRRADFTKAVLRTALISILIATALSACGKSSTQRALPAKTNSNTVVTYAASASVTSFDPASLTSAGADQAAYLGIVYDYLVQFGESATPQPDLATSWVYNSPTQITFQLRRGVTYQDGSAFTAQTAAASLNRSIKAAGIRSASLSPIDTVAATAAYTLQITLKTPDPDLLYTLASGPAAMASPKAFTNGSLKSIPDGTGEYIYQPSKSVPGDHYGFVANPKWWNSSPSLPQNLLISVIPDPTARLHAVQTGQVDLAVVDASDAAQAKGDGLQVTAGPTQWFGLVILDRAGKTVPAFANPLVRQAMALAINRQTFVKAVLYGYGQATDQPIATGQPGFDSALESQYAYNIEKAKSLIARSGFKRITFDAAFSSSGSLAGAEVLQADLAAIGITMTITAVPETELAPLARTTKYPVVAGANFPTYDVYGRYLALFSPKAGFNPFHVVEPGLDSLAAQLALTTNTSKADVIAQEMTDYEVRNGLVVVAAIVDTVVASSHKVTGVVVQNGAPLLDALRVP